MMLAIKTKFMFALYLQFWHLIKIWQQISFRLKLLKLVHTFALLIPPLPLSLQLLNLTVVSDPKV